MLQVLDAVIVSDMQSGHRGFHFDNQLFKVYSAEVFGRYS
jgi:hypothetical protein